MTGTRLSNIFAARVHKRTLSRIQYNAFRYAQKWAFFASEVVRFSFPSSLNIETQLPPGSSFARSLAFLIASLVVPASVRPVVRANIRQNYGSRNIEGKTRRQLNQFRKLK
jgi:hypothetical protein